MPQPCPLCGNQKRMQRPKLLYHHPVYKKCYYRFTNRRQFAFVIDYVLISVVDMMRWTVTTPALLVTAAGNGLLLGLVVLSQLAFLGLLFFKDGLFGQSPGKANCGGRVLDRITGEPINFVASLKRNLPLLIPFMPLFIAFQLCGGPRIGDGWAESRVI